LTLNLYNLFITVYIQNRYVGFFAKQKAVSIGIETAFLIDSIFNKIIPS